MSPMKIFNKLSSGKGKKVIILLFVLLFVLFIIYNVIFDDELYLYYKSKDNQKTNPSESTGKGYYILTDEEKANLNTSSGGMNKNELGGYDVELSQINNALQQILGNLSDEWIKGDTNMTKSQIDFFRQALPLAVLVHIRNPYLFATTSLLQKIEESGWTFTTPTDKYNGAVSNNCFGIKAAGSTNEYWDGSYVTCDTKELMNGSTVVIEDKFKKYNSMQDSFLEHGIFFEINPIYRGGEGNMHQLGITGEKADYRNATDSVEQIRIIQNAGYSTSFQSYVEDVERTYKANDMKRFDDLADKVLKIIEQENSSKTYDGEWNPEKAGVFGEIGLNPDELDDVQQALILDAMSLRDMIYVFGGAFGRDGDGLNTSLAKSGGLAEHTFSKYTELPNSDGTPRDYGADCSSFVNHVYIHALGISLGVTGGVTTETIYYSNNLETVSDRTKGEPGDIITNVYQHVVMILSNNGDGTYKVIEEPQTWLNGTRGHCRIREVYNVPSNSIIRRLKNRSSAKVVQSNFKRVSTKTNKDMEDMKNDSRFQNSSTEARNSIPFTPSKSQKFKIQITYYCDENSAMEGGPYSFENKLLASYNTGVCAAPAEIPIGSYIILDKTITSPYSFSGVKDLKSTNLFRVVDRGGYINMNSPDEIHIDLCIPGQPSENLGDLPYNMQVITGTVYYQ